MNTHMSNLTMTDAQALFDNMCAAWNQADPVGVAATYTPEGRLVIPFGDVYDGREAITAGFAEHFGGILAGTTTRIDVEHVRSLGEGLSVVDATQETTGPLPTLHVTAVLRVDGEEAGVVECRPYAFLPDPRAAESTGG
jgi:uncharacterized protein (TIGR02246 family)